MFYTGVTRNTQTGHDDQRIGIATSTDLINWTRRSAPVFSCADVPWADQAPIYYGGSQQFRDAFVMEDPSQPGKWLMYYTTVWADRTPNMVVGVARAYDSLGGRWDDIGPITSTEAVHNYWPGRAVVESPHIFRRHSQWWLFYTAPGNKAIAFQRSNARGHLTNRVMG
jgi:hypothetical protein